MADNYEQRLDNVIFAGLIGIIVILIEAERNGYITNVFVSGIIAVFIVAFTTVVIGRVYGIILKANYIVKFTTFILRLVIIPWSLYILPLTIYVQFFFNNGGMFLILWIIGLTTFLLSLRQAIKVENVKKYIRK